MKNSTVLFKVGNLVRVRLPHNESGGVQAIIMGKKQCVAYGDPSDAWIKVLIEGEIKDVHVDYIREVYNESR